RPWVDKVWADLANWPVSPSASKMSRVPLDAFLVRVIEELGFLHPRRQVGMPDQHFMEPTRAGSPRTDAQKVRQRHIPAAHRLRWKLPLHPPAHLRCGLTSEPNIGETPEQVGADSAEIWPVEAVWRARRFLAIQRPSRRLRPSSGLRIGKKDPSEKNAD